MLVPDAEGYKHSTKQSVNVMDGTTDAETRINRQKAKH
jgi:hypothetical protein